MKEILRQQNGMTLLETLLAVAILVLVVTYALALLVTGQRSSDQLLQWGDRTQQLRAAMNQLASDSNYGEWVDSPVTGQGFIVRRYMPLVDKDKDNDGVNEWPGSAEWPGYLTEQPPVYIRYSLEGDVLIREVMDGAFRTSSRQVMVTGLLLSSDPAASRIDRNASNHYVNVRLTTRGPGVNRVAEISSAFYLR